MDSLQKIEVFLPQLPLVRLVPLQATKEPILPPRNYRWERKRRRVLISPIRVETEKWLNITLRILSTRSLRSPTASPSLKVLLAWLALGRRRKQLQVATMMMTGVIDVAAGVAAVREVLAAPAAGAETSLEVVKERVLPNFSKLPKLLF
jgi:hypothetical protein